MGSVEVVGVHASSRAPQSRPAPWSCPAAWPRSCTWRSSRSTSEPAASPLVARRLHARPWQPSGPARTGDVLDRGRHRRHHGRMVARNRHLLRVQGRRADAADRAAGRSELRLRRPHRRVTLAGRPHREPSASRSGAVRAAARTDPAPPGHSGIARVHADRCARSDTDRFDRPQQAVADVLRTCAERDAQALTDQRHGDLHRAARPRSAP